MIIRFVPQEKRGVTANVLYLYIGSTYVNVWVAIIRNWYYFGINMSVYL